MTDVFDPPVDLDSDNEEASLAAELAAHDPITDADRELIPALVDLLWAFTEMLSGQSLYPYQEEFGRALITSVVSNDGAELTALFSRQSGKTEVVADVVVGLMVMLPRLAKLPIFARLLAKFKAGMLIGTFAPISEQADTLYDRAKDRLTSPEARRILEDPEIDEVVEEKANYFRLKNCRSLVRVQTAHPKAKVESKTYHLIVIDEAQGADARMIQKSIYPMGANTNATRVLLGTPDIVIGYFYQAIKRGRRRSTERGGKQTHYQSDWKVAAKYNPNYAKYVKGVMAETGPDTDEFRMAYKLEWILERGMFVTNTVMDELGDRNMPRVKDFAGPCIAGIDPARKIDSTVVTVVWVDWDQPNENGLFHHRILDWLEMPGEGWEEQYFRIVEFLSHYNILAVGIDEGGMGDTVVDRLRHLLPADVQVIGIPSSPQAQSKRWKYLATLLSGTHERYGRLLRYPAHSNARRTKTWKRFYAQMTELEKKYQGPYLLAEAPSENGAHDDFPDSLALACILSQDFAMPEIEVVDNMFYGGRR